MSTLNEDFDLEKELKSCKWIVDKIKRLEYYRQNLYAALCNNEFQKIETWNILKDRVWSCSWRYAGGIIADIYGSGDYLDYYCSGIVTQDEKGHNFVQESIITDEIAQDLKSIGWACVTKDVFPDFLI